MEGTIVNGYQLKRLLGEGGMAEVWYAENQIGKPAAVKILYERMMRSEQIVDRFHNEALVMVKLSHPNIRQVYDYGYIGNRHCIVMEYLEGEDLGELLRQGKRFTDEELRRWWNQAVDALSYTHAQGIVHRDIKPSNLFLDKEGNIKLLDFGIAKVKESMSMTRTGMTMGTLMYMSPEQVKDPKRIDARSDNYSLAVSFVHLLTGKPIYDNETNSEYNIQVSIVTQPVDMSFVPPAWRDFLEPYLNKDPDRRPFLRHFEATTTPPPQQTMVSQSPQQTMAPQPPQQTIASQQPKQTVAPSKPQQMMESPKPQQTSSTQQPQQTLPDKPKKKKKGLWIVLGILGGIVATVVIAIVLLVIIGVAADSGKSQTYRDAKKILDGVKEEIEDAGSCDDLDMAEWSMIGLLNVEGIDDLEEDEAEELEAYIEQIDQIAEEQRSFFGCDDSGWLDQNTSDWNSDWDSDW